MIREKRRDEMLLQSSLNSFFHLSFSLSLFSLFLHLSISLSFVHFIISNKSSQLMVILNDDVNMRQEEEEEEEVLTSERLSREGSTNGGF